MTPSPLPVNAALDAYQAQADELLRGWQQQDAFAVEVFKHKHPRFLDDTIKWLPRRLSDSEVRAMTIDAADAQLALARAYDFRDWPALAEHVAAVTESGAPVSRFERAVEAAIDGNVEVLSSLLSALPELVHARSQRVLCFDPAQHRATVLHYLAANGVEGYRQRSPKNARAIARLLLEAGADPNALAGMYGGECTTLSMLVSSTPPAEAGVQVALIDALVDFGASVEASGVGAWTSPLVTALVFGFHDAAEALVRRGARVDTVITAAGLGRHETVLALLPASSADDRHRAFALATQRGHVEIARALLDAGENPNRVHPPGMHAHATPLHHAALGGHEAVVRLLLERGARLDIKDTIYQATAEGWAEHGGHPAIAAFLRGHDG